MFMFALLARSVVHGPDVVDEFGYDMADVGNVGTLRLLLHQTLPVCYELLVFGP